jgi:iron complex transport system substrate-binding protein
MGRLALAAVAAALLLGATACGERHEPTGPDASLYPVTITTGDRPLVVARPAARIAVLDQPAQQIVEGLGAGRRIVVRAPETHINFAALKRAKPDLIVASGGADERDLSRASALTHAQIYVAPGDSIHRVEQAITELGLLTGRPVQARALVRRIEAQRHAVDRRLARKPDVTVFVDTGLFTTISDQSLMGDVIREAHGRNVAADAAAGEPIDPSELRQLDPDVYMATADAQLTLADLKRNPRTRNLRAVRDGRFVTIDTDVLQPGPAIGNGLLVVARLLHPDAFR